MKSSATVFLSFLLLVGYVSNAQDKKTYKIMTVAFYNLENLFDAEDDPNKFDEYSPIMEMTAGREQAYQNKLKNMAGVIAEIGLEISKNSPAIIGVSEVENRKVVEDLVNQPQLIDNDYGIAHFESPDTRGIDVALLYQKSLFRVKDISKHELKIYDNNDVTKRVYTRDQLLVNGLLDGEDMYFIVNHWPSRSGGEARSRFKREKAATLNKRIIDSIQAVNPYAKIITMGDFNDDPTNASITDILGAKGDKKDVSLKGLYNPMFKMLKQGLGSLAYRDSWNLFDQMIVSKPLIETDYSSYRFYKAVIYNKNYLTNPRGRWKGYPYRSWGDGGFTNGYSDHFPVCLYLIKEDNKVP